MIPAREHTWPERPEALERLQEALAAATPAPWRAPGRAPRAGGCFACFPRGTAGRGAAGEAGWAGAAALGAGPEEGVAVAAPAGGPYRPGLLALRAGPLLEAAVRALRRPPDLLLVDATGRDHPRRAGLALHLGWALDVPTIGVTQRPLLARGESPPDARGAWRPLLLGGEVVGAWLRTRRGARPVAVHAAWRTDARAAVEWALALTARARTPEPLRRARALARAARAGAAPLSPPGRPARGPARGDAGAPGA